MILMDRAYAGKKIRELAFKLGYEPIVPPKKNFKEQWEYDKELYKQRNEVERFFRRIKRFRRVFTRPEAERNFWWLIICNRAKFAYRFFC